MNIAKLTSSEKLASVGAVVTIIGGAIAAGSYPIHWGISWIGVIAGLAMLAVVFMPQFAPNLNLPGTKGSLMLVVGGVAAVVMALVGLTTIGFTFDGFDLSSIMFLLAVAGGLVMGWAGWQAFQADGGKFKLGMASAPASPTASPAEPMVSDATAPAASGGEDNQA